jgi:hypothetical protein
MLYRLAHAAPNAGDHTKAMLKYVLAPGIGAIMGELVRIRAPRRVKVAKKRTENVRLYFFERGAKGRLMTKSIDFESKYLQDISRI